MLRQWLAASIPGDAQMLQNMSRQPAIGQTVVAITQTFYEDWLSELGVVKKAFESARLARPESNHFPGSVAQAYHILALRQRLSSLLEEHKVKRQLAKTSKDSLICKLNPTLRQI